MEKIENDGRELIDKRLDNPHIEKKKDLISIGFFLIKND